MTKSASLSGEVLAVRDGKGREWRMTMRQIWMAAKVLGALSMILLIAAAIYILLEVDGTTSEIQIRTLPKIRRDCPSQGKTL
jgi:hypothetical protein